MIDTLTFRVLKRFDFSLVSFEKRRVIKFFEFFFFFRRDNVSHLISVFLKLLKTIRNHMNFTQKTVNETHFFDHKIVKIFFDIFYISKDSNLKKIAAFKFRETIGKKIEKIKKRLTTMEK